MTLNDFVALYYVSASGDIRHWANGAVTALGNIDTALPSLPALNTLAPGCLTIVTPFGNRVVQAPQETTYKPKIVYNIKLAVEALASMLVVADGTIAALVDALVFPVA